MGRRRAGLLGELRRFERPRVRIVAGCEIGGVLTFRLSVELGTLGNGSGGSAARWEQWLMERQLEDVRSAFAGQFGRLDPLWLTVSRMLLQPYIPGDVVAVKLDEPSALRRDGERAVTDERGATRLAARFLPDGARAVRPGSTLASFARAGGDAGAARTGREVRSADLQFLVTEDGRNSFIDAGARPAVGTLTGLAFEPGALDPSGVTLLAAFAPRKFSVLLRRGPTLERTRALIHLASTVRGRVQ
jgi:hypothetical protein